MKLLMAFETEIHEDDLERWTTVLNSIQGIKTITPVGGNGLFSLKTSARYTELLNEITTTLVDKLIEERDK